MCPKKSNRDYDTRLRRLEDALTLAAGGEYDVDIEIDEDDVDGLTAIETGVAVLIADLGSEVQESKGRAAELEEKLELIEKQRQAIEELSTPIIKIWDQVLVLPLIGALDTRRSQRLTESLLTDIAASQTKVAIIDITGIPAVDSAVANHLLKTVASVKLLGAQAIITGIRPEVAQTIVHLGVDLGDVETLSNLAEGLKWAFEAMSIRMVNEAKSND